MPCGSHLFLELFAYAKQANTHINIHHDLKDVKLWQVRRPPPPSPPPLVLSPFYSFTRFVCFVWISLLIEKDKERVREET